MKIFYIYACFLPFVISCCNTTEPKVSENIKLSLYDAGVTETYLHVSFESKDDRTLFLLKNNKEAFSFNCSDVDTIIVDTTLTANSNYTFQVKDSKNNLSNEEIVNTLAPKSHDIAWRTFLFEEQYSGVFWDVTIINENSIWAIGEIYLTDSLGQKERWPHAAAHWDGQNWEFLRVSYRGYGDPRPEPHYGPIFTIASQGEDNIYLGSYANLLKYENGNFNEKAFFAKSLPFEGQIRRIWKGSAPEIYCAGNNGSIYYVYGNSWKKLESNTHFSIVDMWGYYNPVFNNEEILCTSTGYYSISESNLLKILDPETIKSLNSETSRYLASAWTNKGYPIYSCGDGIFSNKSGTWKELSTNSKKFANKIRGTGLNDLFVVGDFGLLLHNNGVDWHPYAFQLDGGFTSIDLRQNVIAITGNHNNKATVVIGTRN